MSRRSGPSVRVRILASILIVMAAGLTASGATAYFVQRERTLTVIDQRLAGAVDDARAAASDQISVAEGEGRALTLSEVLTAIVRGVRPGTNESAIGIVSATSRIVPSGAIDFTLDDDRFVARVTTEAADGQVVRGTVARGERTLRYVVVPVQTAGAAATGAFVVAVDLVAVLRPLDDAFATYYLVAAVSLVLAGVVGWFVAGRLLRPIRSLEVAATRITATDLSERIPVAGRDDVSALTATVNSMLDRLQGALSAQRQLLDDVGHELKTPITIVRGHLELMDPTDSADTTATRDLAIDELDRMSGLVRDISQLAEVQRPMALRIETVDVAALTDRIRVKAMALSSHEWRTPESAHVLAEIDPERITQAMLQLAANAATHGAASGPIEIGSRVDAPDRQLVLWVRDSGVGIDEGTQQHLFERFRRGSAGRGAEGSGLGLAIVAAIARSHGGTVRVDSEPGVGSVFTIAVPLIERTADR